MIVIGEESELQMQGKEPICHGVHGPCSRKGKRRRQNTNYTDDSRNWIVACDECFEEIEEHWAEMWREYYGGVL